VSVTLSPTDLDELRRAQQLLLAPLDGPEPMAWLAAAGEALRRLVAAEHVALMTDAPANPVLHTTLPPPADEAFLIDYAAEDMATPRALGTGRGVTHLSDVVPPEEFYRSRLYHEFARPQGLFDPFMVLARPAPERVVWAVLPYAARQADSEIARRRTLLELAWPAFSAGLASHAALANRRAHLGALLDALPQALLVCDLDGRMLHQTPALTRLLAVSAAGEQLCGELRATVAAVRTVAAPAGGRLAPALAPVARTLHTSAGTYRLSGCVVPEGVLGNAPAVLVQIEPTAPAAPTPAELRERFGLTPREIEVARLLAERRTNREIAAALGISPHTAERHTERVLAKLGVASRTDVRARLAAAAEPG
jgi:DNA-binding CsgD family transcriptional regulator